MVTTPATVWPCGAGAPIPVTERPGIATLTAVMRVVNRLPELFNIIMLPAIMNMTPGAVVLGLGIGTTHQWDTRNSGAIPRGLAALWDLINMEDRKLGGYNGATFA